MTDDSTAPNAQEAKSCCATVYASDWARLLLGDSFHPGGTALTERLGTLLALRPGLRVLDVASGTGASALHLAGRFGCEVTGIELNEANVAAARAAAVQAHGGALTQFFVGNAEVLPFSDTTFDTVICECAFCTFPDKTAAAREFARVLRPGGRLGLSDLTRNGPLPPELQGLLAWIACIADAQPLETYAAYLRRAGLLIEAVERHDAALMALVRHIRAKLLGVELLAGLQQLDLAGLDLDQARLLGRHAAVAVEQGTLGYALLVGTRQE